MFQQIQARGGERHGLAHALEQGHAHLPLDGGHLSAQGGLGQAQLARGRRQRAGFSGLQKRLELVPIELIHAFMYMFTAI
ncbi:hypothetical protein D9M70_634520 [compost metagenome]